MDGGEWDRARIRFDRMVASREVRSDDGSPQRPSYRRYWMALYRRDVAAAERVVAQAMTVWKPHRIYLRLFEPALNLSGALWGNGRIGYQDEHFITHQTLRLMRRVRRQFVPAETHGPLAVVTGVGQESHTVGLRMVCDFLRWDDWRIHWLPSNDRATAAEVVARLQPQAVLLSIGRESGAVPAARLVGDLRRRGFGGVIAIGGLAVNMNPSLLDQVGADLTAPNGATLVRLLRARVAGCGRSPLEQADRAGV